MKATDITKLKALGRLLTAKEHRTLGETLRQTDRTLRPLQRRALTAASGEEARGKQSQELRFLAGVAEAVGDLRNLLDEVWQVEIGNGCAGEEHSPYYGKGVCSHCAGDSEADAPAMATVTRLRGKRGQA